jgi:hypothetical protein
MSTIRADLYELFHGVQTLIFERRHEQYDNNQRYAAVRSAKTVARKA